MTGDIRDKLSGSNAAKSLLMETEVASQFRNRGWESQQGVYFTDVSTGKLREIDVFAEQVLKRPERYKGIGGPLINIHVFCECKSLRNSNIIFSGTIPPSRRESRMQHYWIGVDDDMRHLVRNIAKEIRNLQSRQVQSLYEYFCDRAYHGEFGVAHALKLTAPPVDLVATAFRETKGGEDMHAAKSGEDRISPFWSAIRSSLSAVEASSKRSRETCLEWIETEGFSFINHAKSVERVAFFFDAELMRMHYFHPIIILEAKLWNLRKERLEEVKSARLFIRSIDGKNAFVDVVSRASAAAYIGDTVAHFTKTSRRSILNTWNLLDTLDWEPGQAEQILGKIINPRRSPNKSRREVAGKG